MFGMTVKTFSNWLLGIINEKGWSQAELARRAGVSPAAVSDVISGRRNVGNGRINLPIRYVMVMEFMAYVALKPCQNTKHSLKT